MKIINITIVITLVFILGACSNANNSNNTTQTSQKEIISSELSVVKRINLTQFKEELIKKDSIIIDLRTTQELEKTGIIEGAIQIDYYASDFKEQIKVLDRNKKYLIYCASGGRSSKVLKLMKKLGFKNVYELSGGMNGWLKSGEPTISILDTNQKI